MTFRYTQNCLVEILITMSAVLCFFSLSKISPVFTFYDNLSRDTCINRSVRVNLQSINHFL